MVSLSGKPLGALIGKPEPHVVAMLENFLRDAKGVGIASLLIVSVDPRGAVTYEYHTPAAPAQDYTLIGAADCALSALRRAVREEN